LKWKPLLIFHPISLISYYNEDCLKKKQSFRSNQNIFFVQFLFSKIVLLWDNMEKYRTAVQATGDNTAHELSMRDKHSYKHELRISNAYFVCTTTVAKQLRLSVTVYKYFISSNIIHYTEFNKMVCTIPSSIVNSVHFNLFYFNITWCTLPYIKCSFRKYVT
jgi:hypothetical protein